MKPTNSTLNAILASPEFIVVDGYTITLNDGTILRYTSGDKDIVYSGHTYLSGGVNDAIFNGGMNATLHWKTGLEVDTLNLEVAPRGGTIEGYDWFSAVRVGLLDGAQFNLGRFYMSTYGDTSAGILTVFNGLVGEIQIDRMIVNLTINGYTELFNQPLPRNLYQANCLNTLYDSACTLNQASYAISGTVSSSSTGIAINCGLSQSSGYFDLGKFKMTSGVNNGLWRTVKTYVNGSPSVINIGIPFYTPPSNGDTFTIYPGCDKTMSTCSGKFSNLANFRGFPFIPENSTAS